MVDKNSDQNRARRVSLQTGGRLSMGNKLEVVVGRELVGAALKCACACARHATALLGPGENTTQHTNHFSSSKRIFCSCYFEALNPNFYFVTSKKWSVPRLLESTCYFKKWDIKFKLSFYGRSNLNETPCLHVFLGAECESRLNHL